MTDPEKRAMAHDLSRIDAEIASLESALREIYPVCDNYYLTDSDKEALQERITLLIAMRDAPRRELEKQHDLVKIHNLLMNSELDDETKLRVLGEAFTENGSITNWILNRDTDEATKLRVFREAIAVFGEAVAEKATRLRDAFDRIDSTSEGLG